MLTTEQTFKGVIFKEIKVKHKIYSRDMDLYDIQIEQDNKVVILTLDNLESILKVAKRNFKWNKEVSQRDKKSEEEINELKKERKKLINRIKDSNNTADKQMYSKMRTFLKHKILRLEKELNLRKDRMTGSKAQTSKTDAGRTPLKEKGEKW